MIDELSKLKETLKRVNKIKVQTDLLDCIDIYEKQDDNTYINQFFLYKIIMSKKANLST